MASTSLNLSNQKICQFTYYKTFVNVSPSWAFLLGYSTEALTEMKLEDFLINDTGIQVLKSMELALTATESGKASCRADIRSCGGYSITGELSAEWFGDKDKFFYCSFVFNENAPVIENNLVYQLLSEISLSGMIKYDEYSNILYADKAFETFFGLTNATGAKTYSFFNNQYFASFLKSVTENDECCSIKIGSDTLIIIVEKKDGITTAKVYNKPYLMTTEKKDDFSLILSRKWLWDRLPMMFLVDSENKIILDANHAAAEFYGYHIDEFHNMPLSNITNLPTDIMAQELELALSDKKTYFISRHKIANGQIKDVSYTTSVINIGQKKFILAFLTDVTRRKSLEKVIEEKNNTLMELNSNLSKMIQENQKESKHKEKLFLRQSKLAAVGEMVSSIADYWKEPLNTIGLLVQDMEDADKFGELDAKYIENTAKSVMTHLKNISYSIDTCVNFFKNDNESEIFDVRNVVLNVVKVLDHRFGDANVTICVNCACKFQCLGFDDNNACLSGHIDIFGCVNEFKHAFCNILINSLEAIIQARKNGILLTDDEGLIFVNIESDGKNATITIADNGGGIDEALMSKVFEPYFSTKENGMGIGLYITKQLIEKNMNGEISFENVREGCSVTIKLPCAQTGIAE